MTMEAPDTHMAWPARGQGATPEHCSCRHDGAAAPRSRVMSSSDATGKPEGDFVVPPKATAWPLNTTIAADSRGVGGGRVSVGRHASSSRLNLMAVEGEELSSAGARFAATGVATSDANGLELAAGASSSLGRLVSTASVIAARDGAAENTGAVEETLNQRTQQRQRQRAIVQGHKTFGAAVGRLSVLLPPPPPLLLPLPLCDVLLVCVAHRGPRQKR